MTTQCRKLLARIADNFPKMSPKTMKGWIDNPEELQKLLTGLKKPPLARKKEEEQEARNNWARQRSVQGYD